MTAERPAEPNDRHFVVAGDVLPPHTGPRFTKGGSFAAFTSRFLLADVEPETTTSGAGAGVGTTMPFALVKASTRIPASQPIATNKNERLEEITAAPWQNKQRVDRPNSHCTKSDCFLFFVRVFICRPLADQIRASYHTGRSSYPCPEKILIGSTQYSTGWRLYVLVLVPGISIFSISIINQNSPTRTSTGMRSTCYHRYVMAVGAPHRGRGPCAA